MVLRMLQPALLEYERWLSETKEHRGNSVGAEEKVDRARKREQCGPLQDSEVVDWPALYALRHTLHPKIQIPRRCSDDLGDAESGRIPDGARYSCCSVASGSSRLPEHEDVREGGRSSFRSSLFSSVVSNPHVRGVIADAHGNPVLLPPRCRFLMSHGLGTLGPLLQVGMGRGALLPSAHWAYMPCLS